MKERMASLVLGPVLRHVGERDATVWVETDGPCRVDVIAGNVRAGESTFHIAGHHYAVVALTGLEPGASAPYSVSLDGVDAWPLTGSQLPGSSIRTVDPDRPLRLAFGSCYHPVRLPPDPRGLDGDALQAFARRLAGEPRDSWPHVLVLLGDQVYADETSDETRAFIRRRRDVRRPPGLEVADFEEYTRLYREAWSVPAVRWLLSTIPTSMIFDDHDVRDDWNTSHAWRRAMQARLWWDRRIVGALMSYWVYQHLGNLSPSALAADATLRAVRAAEDGAEPLRAFAREADREADGAKGAQWSYRRDFGGVRLLVIDSRCGRILAGGRRSMVGEREFRWIEDQVRDGTCDHLLVGTSLPWLLPRALHDLESADEAICAGSRGRTMARIGERLRQAGDLEHWAAFRESFDRLARLFAEVGRGAGGTRPPATICVLSGDVHHAYVSEARFGDSVPARVFQLTCSPLHKHIPNVLPVVFRAGWSRRAGRLAARLAAWACVPAVPLSWRTVTGPHMGNHVAVLTLSGRSAEMRLERAVRAESGPDTLTTVAVVPLTRPGEPPGTIAAEDAAPASQASPPREPGAAGSAA